MEAFWTRQDFGRCALSVVAPLTDKKYPAPADLNQQWLDEEYRAGAFIHSCENTFFGGECFPIYFVNFGPGVLSSFVGGGFELAPDTIWLDRLQFVTDWENPPEIKLNTECKTWKLVEKHTRKFLDIPNCITSITDLGGIADILASLRGTENLLYDLYDYPDEVKYALSVIDKIWEQSFDYFNDIIAEKQDLFTSWMGLASKKPWYPIQCDFSALLSPNLFEEFVLPSIVKHTQHLERTIYHLDGEGEIPHLDMLLDVPNLTGIQWVPGAGNLSTTNPKWYPLYKKIQDAKKNIVLTETVTAELEGLIKTLDPTGVFIFAKCDSQKEAEQLLENAEKWCK